MYMKTSDIQYTWDWKVFVPQLQPKVYAAWLYVASWTRKTEKTKLKWIWTIWKTDTQQHSRFWLFIPLSWWYTSTSWSVQNTYCVIFQNLLHKQTVYYVYITTVSNGMFMHMKQALVFVTSSCIMHNCAAFNGKVYTAHLSFNKRTCSSFHKLAMYKHLIKQELVHQHRL